jgi:hypothetical protein
MTSDQFWSIFVMPIGLFICAAPMLIAWLAAERRDRQSQKQTQNRRSSRTNERA